MTMIGVWIAYEARCWALASALRRAWSSVDPRLAARPPFTALRAGGVTAIIDPRCARAIRPAHERAVCLVVGDRRPVGRCGWKLARGRRSGAAEGVGCVAGSAHCRPCLLYTS